MSLDFRTTIHDLLSALPTRKLDALKQLFWSELNYDRANETLSTRQWPAEVTAALAGPPLLFATAGEGAGFHVLYCRLAEDRLLLGQERALVTRLLRDHPYALFVFSDRSQTDWHFVNVRDQAPGASEVSGASAGPSRRVFRRITVGPHERLRTRVMKEGVV